VSGYKSDIPEDAVGRIVSPYREEDGRVAYEKHEYRLDGEVVGYRHFDADGALMIETPFRDGRKHGTEYSWYEPGCLTLAAPYANGLPHGRARQWDDDGNLMGTYTLVRGSGYDIWRQKLGDDPLHVAEIHSMKDGVPHGFEWWVNEDEKSVWHEIHWKEGRRHGVERMWDDGKLEGGCPKFHIEDEIVSKADYIARREADPTLPPYDPKDDDCRRAFPEDVIAAIEAGRA